MTTLTIEGKIPGGRKPLFPDWTLTVPDTRPTLRALLAEIVAHEVEAFRARQTDRQTISLLTQQQIELGVMRGKVDAGGNAETQDVDTETAIVTAIQAFEDGLFYLFLGDEQLTELDEELTLTDTSKLTFIRLTALAGG